MKGEHDEIQSYKRINTHTNREGHILSNSFHVRNFNCNNKMLMGYIEGKCYLCQKNKYITLFRVMVSRKGKDLLSLPIGDLSEEDYDNLRYRGKRNVKPSVDVLNDSYLMSRRRRAVPGATGTNIVSRRIANVILQRYSEPLNHCLILPFLILVIMTTSN